jgi:hypothetical protein
MCGGVSGCGSSPVVQQVAQQSLVAAGGGAGAAMTTSTAMPMDHSMAGMDMSSMGADVQAKAGVREVGSSPGHSKQMYTRQLPEDRTKAAGVLQRLMAATAKYADPAVAQAAGYDFTKLPIEGDILHVPNPAISKANGGHDLDAPAMLLYRKTGDGPHLIGVVLTATRTAPDLGMGEWHTHDEHVDLMKHVFFTPNDLDTAFGEKTPPKGAV